MRSIFDVIWARRWIAVGVLVLALFASPLLIRMLHPTYIGQAQIALIGNGGPSNNTILPSTDIPEVTLSAAVLTRVKNDLHLPYSIDQIQAKTTARMSPHSDVMPIVFSDKNQSYAASVPNALADATVVEYRTLATRQYDQLVRDLRAQLQHNQDSIQSLDQRLQDVAQSDSYVGQENALNSLSVRLSDLETQRGVANATFVADSASAHQSSSDGKLASVYREQALASDPYYVAVRQSQAKDAADLIATKAGYTKAYPGLPGLEDKVARESSEVSRSRQVAAAADLGASATYAQSLVNQRNAEALVAGDKARLQAIDQQLQQVRSHLRNLSGAGVTATSLRLQRDSSTLAYQQLGARLQQTIADQSQASALAGLVVLDYANGASPKIPPLMMAVLIAVIIFIAVVGAAYAAELVDPRLRRPSEVEDLYGGSHLGSIIR